MGRACRADHELRWPPWLDHLEGRTRQTFPRCTPIATTAEHAWRDPRVKLTPEEEPAHRPFGRGCERDDALSAWIGKALPPHLRRSIYRLGERHPPGSTRHQ